MPLVIENSDRAAWGQTALVAYRQGKEPEQIVSAYCSAKEEKPSLSDEPGKIVWVLLSDTLHAIAFDTHGEAASNMILSEDDLPCDEFNRLLGVLAAYVNDATWSEENLKKYAWSLFQEQQMYN